MICKRTHQPSSDFEARPQLSAKKYHYLFLLPFDAEAFKTCKKQNKTYYFVCSTLTWVGSLVDFDCVFLLGLIEVGEGEGGKISVSNLFNYFSVSGDSKQKKNFPQKSGTLTTTGGHHPKVPLFLTPPLTLTKSCD